MSFAALDRWIHGFLPVDAHALAMSRIAFASYFLLVGLPSSSWLAGNPPGFFHPPPLSLAALLGDFPPLWALRALDLAVVLLFLCLLTGFRTRTSSLALTLAWILSNSFRYSFGKIDHDILAVLTPAVMAFSGWGAVWSIDAARARRAEPVRGWPLSLLALLLAFAFFSAGVPKLSGWIDFDLGTQGARSWLMGGWYDMGRRKLLAPLLMHVNNPWFWEAIDVVAVSFELGFLVTLFRRRWFRSFLLVAVLFHALNLVMLNIGFLNLLPVYLVLAPWDALPRPSRWVERLLGALVTPRAWFVLAAAYLPLVAFEGWAPVRVAARERLFSHAGVVASLVGRLDEYSWWLIIFLHSVALLLTLAFAQQSRAAAQRRLGFPPA